MMRLLEISVHWSSNLGVWWWVSGHWKILLHEIAQHEHQILRPRLGLQDSRSGQRTSYKLDDNFQADEKVNIYSRTLVE